MRLPFCVTLLYNNSWVNARMSNSFCSTHVLHIVHTRIERSESFRWKLLKNPA